MAALGVRKSIMFLTNGTLSKLAIGSSEVMLILKAAVVNASTAKFDASSFASIASPFKLSTFLVKFSELYIRYLIKTNTLPIELLIATTISFNCLVENPTARVDLNRFHLGISDITSSVCPNIGPAPIEPPPGTRVGKEPKCVANVSRISSSSIVRIVGVVAR